MKLVLLFYKNDNTMSKNTASAVWQGNLKEGTGKARLSTSGQEFDYTFASRFENGKGTNPEELIAAAHAACYSMALSNIIAQNGYTPQQVATKAIATLADPGDGFLITEIALTTEAKISGIDEKTFFEFAEIAKASCPVSKTLASVTITLRAHLL
jgi:osmotically inducible protein OsmC